MSDNVEKYIKRDVKKSINSKISDKFVDAGLEEIRACINCGTCTGGCPSGRRTAYRTRSALRRALTGDTTVLEDIDIWLCTTCYTCFERCPRNIPVTDMIIKLRNIAVEEGYILDAHMGLAMDVFVVTGHGVPADGEANKKWRDLREAYGLPAYPPTVHSFPEALKEVQTLLESVGFMELMNNAKKLKEERAKKAEGEAKKEEEAK